MKFLSTLILASTLFSSAHAANVLTGFVFYETLKDSPASDAWADVYWYNFISAVSTTTTTTFNPTAGLIMIGDNGEYILNEAAPEVVEAQEKAELELELNELDILILEKLEELSR